MFRLLPTTASCWGSGGKKPPEARVQGWKSCWVWAKPTVLAGFRPRWSRGSATCRRLFLLTHYAEISLSRVVPVSLPPPGWAYPRFSPLTIFDFFRDRKVEGKPGILTCPNGQLQIPKPPRKKRKEENLTKKLVFMRVSGISWCSNSPFLM